MTKAQRQMRTLAALVVVNLVVAVPVALVRGGPTTTQARARAVSSVGHEGGAHRQGAVLGNAVVPPGATTTSSPPAPPAGPPLPGAETVAGKAVASDVIRHVAAVDGVTPVVALTFDDGPDPTWTPQVLDILRRYGIRATFCLVGRSARKHPDLVHAIRDAGHVLCDHTENHVERLDRHPQPDIEREIGDGARDIAALAGAPPKFYRPPGGSLSPAIIQVAKNDGMTVLAWSIDPRDWKARAPQDVLGYVLAGVKPGYVILLHDGGGNRQPTVTALPVLIDELVKRGYRFTTPS